MKKQTQIMWMAILLVLLFCIWNSYSTFNQPKIGIVDNNALISQFSEAIEVRKDYNLQVQEWEGNLKSLEDSLKKTVDVMAGTYEKASKVEQEKMRNRLDQLNSDYRKYANFVETQKDIKLKEMLRPMGEKLDAFLTEWAKENNYDLLLGPGYQGGVILSASKAFNVTKLVLADLHKEYPPKAQVKDSTNTPEKAK